MSLPGWIAEWSRDRGPVPQDGIDWIRSRPESVKALMRRYPPSCVVRVKTERFRPDIRSFFDWYGNFAIVGSVFEGGQIGLRSPNDPELRFRVEEQDVVEVVAFHMGMTREWVAEILSAKCEWCGWQGEQGQVHSCKGAGRNIQIGDSEEWPAGWPPSDEGHAS